MTGKEVAEELLKHPDAEVQLVFTGVEFDIFGRGLYITYDEVHKIIDLTVKDDD